MSEFGLGLLALLAIAYVGGMLGEERVESIAVWFIVVAVLALFSLWIGSVWPWDE